MSHPLESKTLCSLHASGLGFNDYLATDPVRAEDWRRIHDRIALDEHQERLVAGFTRTMPVLVSSGIWCGDCVQQGPLLERIAAASDHIDLRWLDRDEHPEFASSLRINGGDRVPVVVFMSEDFQPVSVLGDRTLTRYRAIAARNLGPSCPLPGAPVPDDELAGTLQDWLDEFERVQLLLRVSPRLRQLHGD
ncbi:MAG: thiol reductase thioredoxin [Planctomycetaceae bacterium]|nr:thiol reductase thioredoxin [Planctomycetaceae bacterium]